MTYSEQIDNAAWTKRDATVSANAVVSPDGYINADKLAENSATSQHDFYQYFAAVGGSTYTASFFAKAAERQYCAFQWSSVILPAGVQYFNLSNGTAVNTVSGITTKIENYGNGWYRFSLTASATGVTTEAAYFVYGNSSNGTTINYTGITGNGTYFYGAQIEAGAYGTSYVPTLGAASTRGVENCYKTGVSSLIGQTEGTLFVDINYNGNKDVSGSVPMRIYTGNNEAYIFITNANALQCELYNITQQCIITGSIGGVGRKKIAFAYKANDFVVYMNGVEIGTDTSGTIGAMGNFVLGGYNSATEYVTLSGINEGILFETRLSNTELAQLTTL